ncbi:sensor histidine kinase [Mangrovicella endophytica]|uniref:sensor histidine kinase n=1 Tax=Mangrovicella endophytica TaxID=2066697 RepID=UPI000C9E7C9C|nr:ATP-binding protein [Mangrovicella endophytica]
MKTIVTSVRIERDTDVAHTRRTARLTAKAAGAAVRDQIRFATAVSEIARNALQYAGGGVAEFAFDDDGKVTALVVRVQDKGPGIPNVENILRSRHQSHTGLGLGLSGSRKLVDAFDLTTGAGGTVATLSLFLDAPADPTTLARASADTLVEAAQGNPLEELAEQNRALRDSLAEQEFLLRELHHRTKNNLAIIQSLAMMQARQVKSPEAADALAALTGRIQAFANAHNYLHRAADVSSIDLVQHLSGLVERLTAAFGTDQIEIRSTVEPGSVDFESATEIGLIVNELVTNAVKHAFERGARRGCIEIRGHRSNAGLMIQVSDDGPGLENAETVLRQSRSLGWRIVEGSARKLNATLEADGSDGLTVTLTIPT